jgi:hypothetical protein
MTKHSARLRTKNTLQLALRIGFISKPHISALFEFGIGHLRKRFTIAHLEAINTSGETSFPSPHARRASPRRHSQDVHKIPNGFIWNPATRRLTPKIGRLPEFAFITIGHQFEIFLIPMQVLDGMLRLPV